MASSDIPANDKGDEQVPTGFLPFETRNVETVKSKSSPPSSESANKRKRESVGADININEETVADKKETGEEHVEETADVKEVEMKDAESIDDGSVDQSQRTKEIEMQDAEVAYNKTDVQEQGIKDGKTNPEIDNNETGSNLNANEGSKKDEISESSEKERNDENGCGQQVLGEVATLLKQVQESDTKAKLQVEVKVKKMENEDHSKENGEVKEEDPNRRSG